LKDALREVLDACQNRPLEWGDPLRKTKHEGGVVCRGICQPLIVEYAVFEKERSVIILKVSPFPNLGL